MNISKIIRSKENTKLYEMELVISKLWRTRLGKKRENAPYVSCLRERSVKQIMCKRKCSNNKEERETYLHARRS